MNIELVKSIVPFYNKNGEYILRFSLDDLLKQQKITKEQLKDEYPEDSKDGKKLHNLAVILFSLFDDIDNAIKVSMNAYRLKSFKVLPMLGALYLLQKDYSNAIFYFQLAIEYKVATPITFNNLGLCLINAHREIESIKYFEESYNGGYSECLNTFMICLFRAIQKMKQENNIVEMEKYNKKAFDIITSQINKHPDKEKKQFLVQNMTETILALTGFKKKEQQKEEQQKEEQQKEEQQKEEQQKEEQQKEEQQKDEQSEEKSSLNHFYDALIHLMEIQQPSLKANIVTKPKIGFELSVDDSQICKQILEFFESKMYIHEKANKHIISLLCYLGYKIYEKYQK